MDDTQSLISVSQKDVLLFNLKRDSAPKLTFTVTNISSKRIVFKVKTTQPNWYYVRPNQQMLDIGKSEDISVALVDTECNRVLDVYSKTGMEENLEKHRFLILSKAIEDSDFYSISNNPIQQRQEDYAKLWQVADAAADTKKNMKLRVEYVYPGKTKLQPTESSQSPAKARTSSGSKSHVAEGNAAETSRQPTTAKSTTTTKLPPSPNSNIYNINDLQILKSKYDTIVEYTVHLTAERDMIVAQHEVLTREYNAELKKKEKSSPRASKSESGEAKANASKGYSFMVLLAVMIIFLLLGRYSP